jgi:hypothetical protein
MKTTHAGRLALVLILTLYSAWLLSYWEPACVAPDTVGLCQQAQHFAESGLEPYHPESPAQMVASHWVQTDDATYRGRFPPGYPALLSVAYRLVGPEWSLLTAPLLGAVAVGVLFFLGLSMEVRPTHPSSPSTADGPAPGVVETPDPGPGGRVGSDSGEEPTPRDIWPGVLGAALLATNPLQNRLVLHGDTHVPAVACILAGLWLLLRWDRHPSNGRAFAVGLAWGLLPSLRYGEVVFSLAAGAFMAARGLQQETRTRRTLWAAVVGAGIPLALLGGYSTLAYGSPWRTGYAFTNEQAAFSLSSIPGHLSFYLSSLAAQPTVGAVVAMGTGALGFMILKRESRPLGLLLLGAILLSVLLYTSYYWGVSEHASLALRFFLPAMACLFVAITWLMTQARGRSKWTLRAIVTGLIILGAIRSHSGMREEGQAMRGGAALVTAARQAVPEGSVMICPRGLGETLTYGGRWRIVPQWLFPGDPERGRIIVPWEVTPDQAREYAGRPAPMQTTRGAALRSHYRGLDDLDLVRAVLTDIREWDPPADVYWIGDPRVVTSVDSLLTNRTFRALGHLAFPGWSEEEATAGGPIRIPARIPIFVLEPGPSPEEPPT